MIDRLRAAIPPAIVAGLAIALVGDTAAALYQAHLMSARDVDAARGGLNALGLGSLALWLTVTLSIALGLGELSSRLRGSAQTLLVLATAVAAMAMARPLMAIYATYVDRPDGKWLRDYFLWSGRVSALLWLASAGCTKRAGVPVEESVAATLRPT